MSKVFGNISPNDQKRLILSPDGLPAVAKNYSNVKMWLKDTHMHTFMLIRVTALMKSEEGERAYRFVSDLYAKED